jgi:hypothetical protein
MVAVVAVVGFQQPLTTMLLQALLVLVAVVV